MNIYLQILAKLGAKWNYYFWEISVKEDGLMRLIVHRDDKEVTLFESRNEVEFLNELQRYLTSSAISPFTIV